MKIRKCQERANASRTLRHYFRAPFLQPRLASADRAMQQVALDGQCNPLKETKRIRASGDREAFTRVDPMRRKSYKLIRDIAKLCNAMDEYIHPEMGAKRKKKLKDIEFISLTDEDETGNKQKNKEKGKCGLEDGFIGKNIKQPEVDPQWKRATSHLHFLLNP